MSSPVMTFFQKSGMNGVGGLYALSGGMAVAYQIRYGPVKGKAPADGRKKAGRRLLAALCAAALLIGLPFSGIGKTIWNWLLPGDAAVTGAALNTMVEEIRAGESVSDAVTAFCREIIENAKTPE